MPLFAHSDSPPLVVRSSIQMASDKTTMDPSLSHLMIVKKVLQTFCGSSSVDKNEIKERSQESGDEETTDNDELDDLMTLDQYQKKLEEKL